MSLKVENLIFSYPGQKESVVLSDLCFEFFEGQSYSISGPSGCGKSTLSSILMGYLAPKKGRVVLGEREIHGVPSKKVLQVSQEDDLLSWMRVGEQLSRLAKTTQGETLSALEELGVGHAYHLYPHELSVGMKKRASLARTLLGNPQVIILDEFFASLDQLRRESVLKIVQDWVVKNQSILIVITHDPIQLGEVGHSLTLREGKLVDA